MKKRDVFIVLFIILLLLIIVGIFYYFINNRTYKLNLPEVGKLGSISLEQDTTKKVISDSKEIQNIVDILNEKGRNTKNESIQDNPVNTSKKIKIDFKFNGSGSSTIFVYEKNNKHYIEQPYNGIYKISVDEYHLIEKYIN